MTPGGIGGTGRNVIPTKRDHTRAITWTVICAVALLEVIGIVRVVAGCVA